MTAPAPPAPLIWNARAHSWEPAGQVWDRRLLRCMPAPADGVIEGGSVSDESSPSDCAGPADGRGGMAGNQRAGSPPRKVPTRTRRKRWGAGPRARQPTRNGQPIARARRVRWASG